MNILSLETATDACSIALLCNDRVYSRFEIAPRLHAKLLLPMIHDVLREANVSLSSLNAIAYGAGPGSFMGVRLATGMAQGLAFGLEIPVIPISTLQVLAQTAFEKTHEIKIAAGWDARMHEIYWGFYVADHNKIMQAENNDAMCTPANLDIHFLLTLASVFAGNAWHYFDAEIPDEKNKKDIYPDAKAMLTIAQSKFQNNEIVSPVNAHPTYLRHHVVHNHK